MQKFGILVLAAGQSSRFNGDKLLAPMADGRPVIAHSLSPLIAIANKYQLAISVIVRANNKPLIDYLEKGNIHYCICPDAELGMGHSIAHGVKSNQAWQGWMISLADMPKLNIDILDTLVATIKENSEKVVRPQLISSGYDKAAPSHPVFFPQKYGYQLSKLKGDSGAKHLIKDLNPIDLHNTDCFIDVDTRELLNKARHTWQKR